MPLRKKRPATASSMASASWKLPRAMTLTHLPLPASRGRKAPHEGRRILVTV